ncbi:MAG: hypothetical protein B7Z66_09130 [Chromatiales bacterium 21-64-14]|nr:MAG: hypothetical protein B7Z66_09130 [Chromatiales bacterium 21-64-14]HQU15273.1 lipopolysaccharide assembly protein LapA domain-containing protein [Gammaproteobacteria bacterium]
MNPRLALVFALVTVVLVFVVQNTAVVDIRLFFWTVSLSRALLVFLLLAVGVVMGWLLRAGVGRSRRK